MKMGLYVNMEPMEPRFDMVQSPAAVWKTCASFADFLIAPDLRARQECHRKATACDTTSCGRVKFRIPHFYESGDI
jgi:hypothetical protein